MASKSLTIAVDIRPLQKAKTGIYTYLDEICKAFGSVEDERIRFVFLGPLLPVYTGPNSLLRLLEHLRFQIWKQVVLPLKAWRKKCDVVFCVDDIVPFIHLGYTTIPVFHDAFLFETPENYGKVWLWTYLKTAIPAAKRSPYIVTPTYYAQRQINNFTHIPTNKLVVIYEGANTDQDLDEIYSEDILSKYDLGSKQFLLHVGAPFKRKNLPLLVNAFESLKREGNDNLKLVLAGPLPANNMDSDHNLLVNYIKEHQLEHSVILTGYLTKKSINNLYDNALFYVFPSLNEGFGIPVLEAFSHGLPVVVANNTCLPEIGGNAVLQFDPHNVNELQKAMSQLLNNDELRAEMTKKGYDRLKIFSWQNTASQLIELFRKAVHENVEQ